MPGETFLVDRYPEFRRNGVAQALHDQLTGRGVTILTDPFDGPFGCTFALRDPDGYAVTIHDGA